MRIRLVEDLARLGNTFTIEDAVRVANAERNVVWVILSRLEKRGWVERVERGKYIIVPLSSEKGKMTLHEFQLGSMLVQPNAIAYWSALNYHGFTEQIPTSVFLQTTGRKKNMKPRIFDVDYHIIRLTIKKFFGLKKEWIDEASVHITDREKTIVDCLDKPHLCGGVIEVLKAFPSRDLDIDKLIEYADRMGNTGILRRLGFISDYHNLGLEITSPDTRNYLYVDPTLPRVGEKIAKWRVIDNIQPMIKGGLE